MTDLKITEAITVQFPMVQFRARSGRSRLQNGEGRPQGARLQGEVTRPGTVELLRKGLRHGPHRIDLSRSNPGAGQYNRPHQSSSKRFLRHESTPNNSTPSP